MGVAALLIRLTKSAGISGPKHAGISVGHLQFSDNFGAMDVWLRYGDGGSQAEEGGVLPYERDTNPRAVRNLP
jgi:hypothetical protein